ncbi:hypothetical protein ACPDHL_15200 [Myroides sp. C15-4]|uniref:hypothetical protein n=1 Tax=Myroides sp. C15-4 TaxID=3400532 RepID=UPI003D2F9064
MNRLFSIFGILTLVIATISCNKSDDSGSFKPEPLKDAHEVYVKNKESILKYLKNNYMIERNGVITFDSITSVDHTNEKAVFYDSRLDSIVVNNEDYAAFTLVDPYDRTKTIYKYSKSADTVKYKIYYLVLNEGQGQKSAPVDSIFVKRASINLKNERITSNNHPTTGGFYSFPPTVAELRNSVPAPLRMHTGERQMLKFIKTAISSGINPDGTISFDETTAGRIIVFMPSGIGQFNSGYDKLKAYEPYISDLTLVSTFERDHDLDGIPSKFEVKPEKIGTELTIHDYFDLDTNNDNVPNFLDIDDDGDGVPTRIELQYKDANGKIKHYNYDAPELKTCSGTPRYLDNTCKPFMVDGEWVWPSK